MLLSELRTAIESGKTAKLFVPKTHEYGIDLTVRVVKREEDYIWQRATVEAPLLDLNLPATNLLFSSWEELFARLQGGMQLRDSTWEECEEPIEILQSQLLESLSEGR